MAFYTYQESYTTARTDTGSYSQDGLTSFDSTDDSHSHTTRSTSYTSSSFEKQTETEQKSSITDFSNWISSGPAGYAYTYRGSITGSTSNHTIWAEGATEGSYTLESSEVSLYHTTSMTDGVNTSTASSGITSSMSTTGVYPTVLAGGTFTSTTSTTASRSYHPTTTEQTTVAATVATTGSGSTTQTSSYTHTTTFTTLTSVSNINQVTTTTVAQVRVTGLNVGILNKYKVVTLVGFSPYDLAFIVTTESTNYDLITNVASVYDTTNFGTWQTQSVAQTFLEWSSSSSNVSNATDGVSTSTESGSAMAPVPYSYTISTAVSQTTNISITIQSPITTTGSSTLTSVKTYGQIPFPTNTTSNTYTTKATSIFTQSRNQNDITGISLSSSSVSAVASVAQRQTYTSTSSFASRVNSTYTSAAVDWELATTSTFLFYSFATPVTYTYTTWSLSVLNTFKTAASYSHSTCNVYAYGSRRSSGSGTTRASYTFDNISTSATWIGVTTDYSGEGGITQTTSSTEWWITAMGIIPHTALRLPAAMAYTDKLWRAIAATFTISSPVYSTISDTAGTSLALLSYQTHSTIPFTFWSNAVWTNNKVMVLYPDTGTSFSTSQSYGTFTVEESSTYKGAGSTLSITRSGAQLFSTGAGLTTTADSTSSTTISFTGLESISKTAGLTDQTAFYTHTENKPPKSVTYDVFGGVGPVNERGWNNHRGIQLTINSPSSTPALVTSTAPTSEYTTIHQMGMTEMTDVLDEQNPLLLSARKFSIPNTPVGTLRHNQFIVFDRYFETADTANTG